MKKNRNQDLLKVSNDDSVRLRISSNDIVEQYICVICRDLLIDPVTLPCEHTACLDCLEKTLDNNKYQCFLCRKFIGSWYRNAKRKNSLINEKLKNSITVTHPDLFALRLKGETLDIIPTFHPIPLCSPGEIKQEYEFEMQKMKREVETEKEKENKLSEDFIKQIKEEENILQKQEEELLKTDEQIARELELELNDKIGKTEDEKLEQLSLDEALARKLASDNLSNNLILLKTSPSIKRSPKAIRGPMDRFLAKKQRL